MALLAFLLHEHEVEWRECSRWPSPFILQDRVVAMWNIC
jgi:hypothetical protein